MPKSKIINYKSSPQLLELKKLQEKQLKQQILLNKQIIDQKLFTQNFLKMVQEEWLGFYIKSQIKMPNNRAGNDHMPAGEMGSRERRKAMGPEALVN